MGFPFFFLGSLSVSFPCPAFDKMGLDWRVPTYVLPSDFSCEIQALIDVRTE